MGVCKIWNKTKEFLTPKLRPNLTMAIRSHLIELVTGTVVLGIILARDLYLGCLSKNYEEAGKKATTCPEIIGMDIFLMFFVVVWIQPVKMFEGNMVRAVRIFVMLFQLVMSYIGGAVHPVDGILFLCYLTAVLYSFRGQRRADMTRYEERRRLAHERLLMEKATLDENAELRRLLGGSHNVVMDGQSVETVPQFSAPPGLEFHQTGPAVCYVFNRPSPTVQDVERDELSTHDGEGDDGLDEPYVNDEDWVNEGVSVIRYEEGD